MSRQLRLLDMHHKLGRPGEDLKAFRQRLKLDRAIYRMQNPTKRRLRLLELRA